MLPPLRFSRRVATAGRSSGDSQREKTKSRELQLRTEASREDKEPRRWACTPVSWSRRLANESCSGLASASREILLSFVPTPTTTATTTHQDSSICPNLRKSSYNGSEAKLTRPLSVSVSAHTPFITIARARDRCAPVPHPHSLYFDKRQSKPC